ncbi:hypothetical protein [Chamaesiphon sp. VAR_48_metabat_135_sub]|uniref:hypothetical protein n=1 Tax=Chamaesiphon sp. VAR_48_metabat_135_sub TaxID=2964699 RepID=UPI00286AFB50|nr:hypothetical protein [Chamaesiphon sp. VAR_48_metabat_135_sub]
MHSATRLDDLKILECFLQNSLHAHLGRIIPFRVQCLYKDDTLWVLAQHPADVVIDIPDTFSVLEHALQAEEPKTPLAVKLYLRAEGNQRPYSQQSFTVYPLVKKTVPGEAAPEMTGMSEDRIALERDLNDIIPGHPLHVPANHMDNSNNNPSTVPEIVSSGSELASIPSEGELRRGNRLVKKIDTDVFVEKIEHSFGATKDSPYQSAYPPASRRRRKMIVPILGGLGLLAIGSGVGYMGTRPCVLSVCTELNTATQLTRSSLATLNNPSVTGQEVLTAQKQIHQSVKYLNSIPLWSGSHGAAQKSLAVTTAQSADLDTTVTAMNQAFKAATIVKTPPIPLVKWQESKQLWTNSIENLGKVPTTSQIYPLARQKLTNYQGRLADIDRRIQVETTAEQKLKSAVDGIKAATKSQAAARSLAQWRGVKTEWDRVNSQLISIPATTTVYTQAQALLSSYQPQISIVQDKVLEEDKAIQNYQTALKLAQAAKLAQKNNQLAQSVSQWNQSVVAIQSIPQNSSIYAQAKPLVLEYTKSFQQVEAQLKTTQKIVLANKDLQRTCAGTPQICTYMVTGKSILVRLMPLYTQTLKQTAMVASTQGDSVARVGIVNHVNTLGNALQTISENAKLPLEVYGADGKQIQNYRP